MLWMWISGCHFEMPWAVLFWCVLKWILHFDSFFGFFFPGSNINAFSLNCQLSHLSAKKNLASHALTTNQMSTSLSVFPCSFDLFACYVSLKSLTNKSKIPSDLRKGLSLALCVLVLLSLSLSFLSVWEHRDSLWFVPCRLWIKEEKRILERETSMATLKTQSTKTKQGIRAILYNKTSHSCCSLQLDAMLL